MDIPSLIHDDWSIRWNLEAACIIIPSIAHLQQHRFIYYNELISESFRNLMTLTELVLLLLQVVVGPGIDSLKLELLSIKFQTDCISTGS
jgi:hypothetical protein